MADRLSPQVQDRPEDRQEGEHLMDPQAEDSLEERPGGDPPR